MSVSRLTHATPERRQVLLSRYTSRRNKVWLATGWRYSGMFIEWRYQGEEDNSRMEFRFAPDGPWVRAQSYEDDIRPTLEFNRPPRSTSR